MARESLDFTVIVVTDAAGNETEVRPDALQGNLDTEASESLLIGRAVRAALMASEEDGATIEVRVYSQ